MYQTLHRKLPSNPRSLSHVRFCVSPCLTCFPILQSARSFQPHPPMREKKSPRTFNAKKSSRNPDANHTVTYLPRNPHPRNDIPNQTIIPQPRIATPRADRAVQVSAPIDPVRSCLLDKNCPAIGAEHQTSNALVSASLFFLLPPSALRSVPCVSHHDVVWQLAADRCSRSEM
jgi:hypothetical protein